MKHIDKVKLARRLLSNEEKRLNIPIFSSKNWISRKFFRTHKLSTLTK